MSCRAIIQEFVKGSGRVQLVDGGIPFEKYVPLDLSVENEELAAVDLTNSAEFGAYVEDYLKRHDALAAYGGYMEKRAIYQRSENFKHPSNPGDERNIHIGLDVWAKAGTAVLAAFDGVVHSYQNNAQVADYGPTIILEHEINGCTFYSLYGHLSVSSLDGLYKGQVVKQGATIATLGEAAVNGDYPPHLHFQLIIDLQGKSGDYPGVCSANELGFYQENCPDPTSLIR